MHTQNLIDKIFTITNNFNDVAIEIFNYQYRNNKVYQQWVNALQGKGLEWGMGNEESEIKNIPFLPISFFKTHKVVINDANTSQIFESSGTTNTSNSKHYIYNIEVYKQSFLKTFTQAYGNVQDWCIIGLLPSYLERNNSSLIFMVNELINQSNHEKSGFYLYDFEKLCHNILSLESQKQKTLIIGVTFALLDFVEQYKMNLQYTTIIETGGMKGRKKEMTKDEVHKILMAGFGIKNMHSEYGMTELLSQAYAKGNNIHHCPPWMKIFVRDEEDPLLVRPFGKGVINIIDLANIYSCSFIATDDVGEVFEDGSFKIYGRLDNSDLRGCSLLYL